MATVVIIGAGFAGHTAALYLGKELGEDHDVVVVNREATFLYLPSLIWLGVGHMAPEKMTTPLEPVYGKLGVRFVQGSVTAVHPDDNFVTLQRAGADADERLDYDFLVVATGPHLNFAGTPGLGPHGGHTESVCWTGHAMRCRDAYLEQVERMRAGERSRIVIGTGHAQATCQGAAFEYIANIHQDLVCKGLRDKADLLWFSNEPALGDFGVGGVQVRKRRATLTSDEFLGALFREYGVRWELLRSVDRVEEGCIHWEDGDGEHGQTEFDLAMLIPQFQGPRLEWVGENRGKPYGRVVNEAGFVIVDGYYGLSRDELRYTPEAWPATYQNPSYPNIFAAGIAFATPGTISAPHTTPNGTTLVATAPRTGMVSATIGRLVALNIAGLIKHGEMRHQERMTEMFTACIASMGDSLWSGSGVTVLVYPVVPNFMRYPDTFGRDPAVTHMQAGLAGAWLKRIIHTTMLHKARARLGWRMIPE